MPPHAESGAAEFENDEDDDNAMQEQEQKLRAEILEDAQRKAARLVQRATRDAEKVLDGVRQRLAQRRLESLEKAELEAAARQRAIAASIRHELRAEWLRRREQEFAALFRRALDNLESAEGVARRESLKQLLEQATAMVDSPETRVRARPSDLALIEDVAAALTLEADASLAPGVLVASGDGQRRVDNTYRARLQRLRALILEQLRIELGAEAAEIALPEWETFPKDGLS